MSTPQALDPNQDYYSYTDLVRSFATILVQHDDDDYQGDSRLLLTDETGRLGLLTFGWGSCSGCDALQAAEGDIAAITELRDSLATSVHWEDNAQSLIDYIDGKDWSLDYSDSPKFRAEARAKLAELAAR